MTELWRLDLDRWDATVSTTQADEIVAALEHGSVLFLPSLRFRVTPEESSLFSPEILASSKNASFDPPSGRVSGTSLAGDDATRLTGLMTRFSRTAGELVQALVPRYWNAIQQARSSFRPAEVAGRVTSWRKDDTRLHVDSFPASPVHGRRILRLFSNVNPLGRPRSWRVGDDFESLARRFVDRLSLPWPGTSLALRALRITKTRRSAYDALMLQLHDAMKADDVYQRESPQQAVDFPAGSTWMTFTDQVSHAAMAGQYQLEQTFLLPVAAMADERRSPLRILEQLKARRLV